MRGIEVRHKSGWLAACDFMSLDRAKAWISELDPQRYVDKTLKREDFHIFIDNIKQSKEEEL